MTQRHQFWVKDKWWLRINKKRNHAVLYVVWVHILKGSERWKKSTITSVLTENWDHLHNSLTVAFYEVQQNFSCFHNTWTGRHLTELTTVHQTQNKSIYLHYELWEMCPIFEQNSLQMYESWCCLWCAAVSLRWLNVTSFKWRAMCDEIKKREHENITPFKFHTGSKYTLQYSVCDMIFIFV